jgi:hypothetical protein
MAIQKAPKQVTVSIFTTITIIFWIFLGVYRILTTTPPLEIDPSILETIDPKLDQKSLGSLQGKIFYEEGQVQSPYSLPEETSPSLTPTPQATPTLSATPSSSLLYEEVLSTPTLSP